MIKNYIFDFGQVLVEFDPIKLTCVYTKNSTETKLISDAVFDRIYWDRLDAGTITDDEVRAGFCERLPEDLHNTAIKVYDRWIENLTPIHQVIDMLPKIKQAGGKLFLLSNISRTFAENYINVPHINNILSQFEGLIFSGEIGITKPSTEIFEYLLKKYNLNADECIFIDDSEKNIEGAKKAGIMTHLFDGDAKKLELSLF